MWYNMQTLHNYVMNTCRCQRMILSWTTVLAGFLPK
jgi:hypothetical protein